MSECIHVFQWTGIDSETACVKCGTEASASLCEELQNRAIKSESIIKKCLSVMPFGNIKTHNPESLPGRIEELSIEVGNLGRQNDELDDKLEKAEAERDELKKVNDDLSKSLNDKAWKELDRQFGEGYSQIKAERDALKEALRKVAKVSHGYYSKYYEGLI